MTRRGVWLFGASLGNLLFLYLPIAVLVVFSFNDSRFSAVWQGFSLRWYRALASDDALMAALQNSLIVGSAPRPLRRCWGCRLRCAWSGWR